MADDASAIGNSPELAAQAVFANYLKLNNRMDLFTKILNSNSVSASFLSQVVKIA